MFFEAAKQGKNKWWQYLISIFIILFTWLFLGTLVLVAGIYALLPEGTDAESALSVFMESADFSTLGISQNIGLVLMISTFACGLLGLWFCIKAIHKRPFKTLITPRKSIDYKKILTAAGLWFAFMGGFEIISYFIDPSNYVFQFDATKFFPLLLISLLILPIQTSFEELLMRGYLMQGIGLATGNRLAPLIVTSVLFGSLHLGNPEVQEFGMEIMMVNYIQIGLMLGIITLMDDGLELALGVHAANNIYGATMVTFSSSALQTPAIFSMQELNIEVMTVAGLLASFIFILLLAKIYGWKDWSRIWGPIKTLQMDASESDIHSV